ncbi:DUF3551 domain-containing protein [Bradyrhizobium sp. GCM10028915]|uniref:DUF3551 domain-containing protein n=1 Tax=Bradyrhizobium sp. GCM10028915 TaxID=3273385 RepID=UPI003620D776
MRHPLLILGLGIPILVGAAQDSVASPRDRAIYMPAAPPDLYCLRGRTWGYPGNCQFLTYSQCSMTASGTDAYCGMNPTYAFRQYGWGPR